MSGGLEETRLDGEQLLDGRLLKVYRDRVRLPGGGEGLREWIRHPGAVAVVPWLRDRRELVLVRQFRYPPRETFLELPAGKLDPGEAPEACGRRELAEETGWRAGRLVPIQPFLPCIGYSDEIIHLYYTDELEPGLPALDAGESLEALRLPLADLKRLYRSGALRDSKTLIGVGWLLLALAEDRLP
jgi:ADP-ribose pyrophosphatase